MGRTSAGATSATSEFDFGDNRAIRRQLLVCRLELAREQRPPARQRLTVNPAAVAPTITTPPTSQTVTAGANCELHCGREWHGTARLPVAPEWGESCGSDECDVDFDQCDDGTIGRAAILAWFQIVLARRLAARRSLTVNPAIIAPTITTPPANQSVTAGANVSFTVTASGTAPLAYQWRLNGVEHRRGDESNADFERSDDRPVGRQLQLRRDEYGRQRHEQRGDFDRHGGGDCAHHRNTTGESNRDCWQQREFHRSSKRHPRP
jgi:hypothetical protein